MSYHRMHITEAGRLAFYDKSSHTSMFQICKHTNTEGDAIKAMILRGVLTNLHTHTHTHSHAHTETQQVSGVMISFTQSDGSRLI